MHSRCGEAGLCRLALATCLDSVGELLRWEIRPDRRAGVAMHVCCGWGFASQEAAARGPPRQSTTMSDQAMRLASCRAAR
jgi:16S rRNA G1207 methylase RsmC